MTKRKIDFRNLSLAQKVAKVEGIYIWSPKLRELITQMDYCREFSKIASEPKSMLIIGIQGAGKTKLIERYMEKFPRTVTSEKTIVPVLSSDVGVPATVKSLASDLLAALGDPAADKGTVANQTRRLCMYLKKCETQMIILDEFQHFIDRESQKVLRTISDWLKVLINRTKLPIILFGMPKSEIILDTLGNEQLKRRFSSRESLEPFGWGEDEDQQEEMKQFLAKLDEALSSLLPRRSHLADTDTAHLIHVATNGIIEKIMKLIRGAAASALRSDAEYIDLNLLANSYEENLANDFPEDPNPFHIGISERKTGKRRKPRQRLSNSSNSSATNKRVRARKEKPSLSEVLSVG